MELYTIQDIIIQKKISQNQRDNSKTVQDLLEQSIIAKNSKNRKQQSIFIYTSIVILTILYAIELIVYFNHLISIQKMTYIMWGFTASKILCLLISISKLSTLIQICKIFFILDPILLAEMTASICLVYLFLMLRFNNYYLIALLIISNHLYSVNFRIMMLRCKWNSMEVVIYKICLSIVCLFFVVYGGYLLKQQMFFSKDGNSDISDTIQQYLSLFIFSQFSFFYQMQSKLSDFDKTSQLKTVYILLSSQQNQLQQSITKPNKQQQSKHNINKHIHKVYQIPQNITFQWQ